MNNPYCLTKIPKYQPDDSVQIDGRSYNVRLHKSRVCDVELKIVTLAGDVHKIGTFRCSRQSDFELGWHGCHEVPEYGTLPVSDGVDLAKDCIYNARKKGYFETECIAGISLIFPWERIDHTIIQRFEEHDLELRWVHLR
jgi:hypothetical protein